MIFCYICSVLRGYFFLPQPCCPSDSRRVSVLCFDNLCSEMVREHQFSADKVSGASSCLTALPNTIMSGSKIFVTTDSVEAS